MKKNIYANGNYTVVLYEDGTKIRLCKDDIMIPSRPECIDICISKRCRNGCSYCYEGCTEYGAEADLQHPVLDTIPPYTEIAVNLNSSIPEGFEQFLKRMKDRNVIVNATVNGMNLNSFSAQLRTWQGKGLIHGIGVSVNGVKDLNSVMEETENLDHLVIHSIAGIIDPDIFKDCLFYNDSVALLILGYKKTGRGEEYLDQNKNEITQNISGLKDELSRLKEHFGTICFDNLALEQLDIPYEGDIRYMGDDGQFTFAINLVEESFAKNSRSTETYPINDNSILDMFKAIQVKQEEELA